MSLRVTRFSAHRWLSSLLFCLTLAGCGSSILKGDRGPNATLFAADVQSESTNASQIIAGLVIDNDIDVNAPTAWYDVSVAGFNYVDDQCNAYFDDLFFLNREKDTVKGLLNAAGQTTSAVLAVTKASSLTLAVVSQAFGFGTSATELVAGTFLYQLPPATTLGFVTRQQTAFRAGAVDQAKNGLLRTRSDAYHLIQQYLALCLPPSIEAEIVKQISGTQVKPDPNSPAGSVSLIASGPPSPGLAKTNASKGSLSGPNNPIPKPPQHSPYVKGAANGDEANIFAFEFRDIQNALCLDADGDLGALSPKSRTRRSIDDYLSAFQSAIKPGQRGALTDESGALKQPGIDKLYKAKSLGGCAQSGFENAFEVGTFGVLPLERRRAAVSGFQTALEKALSALGTKASLESESGDLGRQTRNAIAEYRNKVHFEESNPDGSVDTQLNQTLLKCITIASSTCPLK